MTRALVPIDQAGLHQATGVGSSNNGSRGLFGKVKALLRLHEVDDRERPTTVDQLLPVGQFSISGLRAELRVIDQEISGIQTKLVSLDQAEREALERRDKSALDVAWDGREILTSKLAGFEQRREIVFTALTRRLDPEVEAWRQLADSEVQRWRAQDATHMASLIEHLRAAQAIDQALAIRCQQRSQRRKDLLAEFDGLVDRALPVQLERPEVDWTVPPVDLGIVLDLLESTQASVRLLAQTEAASTPHA